jgi:hypothetical protein
MACQATNSIINKPYDDELCRVGLYNILECLLINERADCSTIIAISKDLIDNAALIDSSVKVRIKFSCIQHDPENLKKKSIENTSF